MVFLSLSQAIDLQASLVLRKGCIVVQTGVAYRCNLRRTCRRSRTNDLGKRKACRSAVRSRGRNAIRVRKPDIAASIDRNRIWNADRAAVAVAMEITRTYRSK